MYITLLSQTNNIIPFWKAEAAAVAHIYVG